MAASAPPLVCRSVPSHRAALPQAPTQAHAADGIDVFLRQLRPGETRVISAVFAAMTAEQRASRFNTGMPRLSEGQLRYLAAVDDHAHVAYVAMLGERPVGIARYVLVAPSVAEVAVEVANAFTGRGVASVLLAALRQHALREGVRRIALEMRADNARALHLAHRAGARMWASNGEVLGSLDLVAHRQPALDHLTTGASCLSGRLPTDQ